MWQRFTERARKAIFYAQEEAERLLEPYVSTEHLLLGLIREAGRAAQILGRLNISSDHIRYEVERQTRREEPRASQDMTLTPRAKRVIDLAYDEARNLKHDYIGTEHLLLGLIREEESVAARILKKSGANLHNAREILGQLGERQPSPDEKERLARSIRAHTSVGPKQRFATPEQAASLSMWKRYSLRSRSAIHHAQAVANKFEEESVSISHILLGLLLDEESSAVQVLKRLDLPLEKIRNQIEELLPQSKSVPGQELSLSPAGKRVIDLAYTEARDRASAIVGTEHLLLAILRTGDERMLAGVGLESERVRREIDETFEHSYMWQRFTAPARQAVFFAQDEAQKMGHGFVCPEHLLLALLREPKSTAMHVLSSFNVLPETIRADIESRFAQEAKPPPRNMTLADDCKRVIDLAYGETRMIESKKLGTGELLLGIIGLDSGVASQVLAEQGIELVKARREVKGKDE